MQLSYSSQEDRLILSINSKENEEMRLFLTRRIVTSFWDILNRTIDHTSTNKPKLNDMQKIPVTPIPQNAGKEVTPKQMEQQMEQQIYHQNIISESDYKTPFNKSDKFPMGEAPILVEKITINTYEDGNIMFVFKSIHGKDISLNLNLQILHNLSDLLTKVMPATEWNITLMSKTNVMVHEEKSNASLH
ncbi:hypothetical protein CRYPD_802 [uncultured Candidatus Thioglobus sp.]|nr:hypothetical protein CRYPD_802 [uncultured Candidatus Thioglobus sp.]